MSCGGTGTYWISRLVPGVTEVQAGGGIFGDVHYREDYGVEHEQALTILTTVASRPTPTRIVCDAGMEEHVRPPDASRPLDLGRGAEPRRVGRARDDRARGAGREPAGGGPRRVRAGYCDSTLFLHDELYGVRDGRVEAVWPIAGRGKTR